MGPAIGGSLVMAVGISITPLAMAAAVFLLSTPKPRTNGIAFVMGWILGLLIIGAITLTVLIPTDPGTDTAPALWASWMRITLGLLLLALGIYELRLNPTTRPARAMPAWVERADDIGPPTAFGVGFVLAGLRPKNILLVIAGAATIVSAGISRQAEAITYLLFAAIATIGVAVPVVLYIAMGDRGPTMTRSLGDWLTRNTAVIMSVVCIVIGADLIGRGIVELTS